MPWYWEWYHSSVRTLCKSPRGHYRWPAAVQWTCQRLLLKSCATIKCTFQNFQKYQFEVEICMNYNSFIASNFNYWPLVVHFCGKANSNKLEKLQERSLRILYNDFDSPIHNLINESGQRTLLSNRLKYFILEVFKSIRKLNVACLHDILSVVKYHIT